MLSKERVYEILALVSKKSKYYTVVNINSKEEGLTRFANSEIHQNVYNIDTEITINVINDNKISSVSTNVIDAQSILEALSTAEAKLEYIPQGEFELIQNAGGEPIEHEGFNEALNNRFDIEKRAAMVAAGVELLPEGYIAAGSISLINTSYAWGDSKGTKRFTVNSEIAFTGMVMHESGASSYIEKTVKNPEEIDVSAEFSYLLERARMGINPISIEPGHYDVVLEPMAVGDIINYTGYLGFSSKFHEMGMSCLTGKIDTKVFGDNITIMDDFTNPVAKYLPFDFEGCKRSKLKLVEQGVAKEIAFDTITAMKAGTTTTGHSLGYTGDGGIPLCIAVEGGDSSVEDMIKSTKKGLLVSRFHYMNIVNPKQGMLTALTRDGLFLIEDGKIKGPVFNLRFTDSIEKIFNNVELISAKRVGVPGFEGSVYVPAMKVKNFHFTGKTVIE